MSKVHKCKYDDFVGEEIGRYRTREDKLGLVLQQLGTRVVHVYGLTSLEPVEEAENNQGDQKKRVD